MNKMLLTFAVSLAAFRSIDWNIRLVTMGAISASVVGVITRSSHTPFTADTPS